jgi:D-beta-D-heptose 7-phosphate kinase/D-beta-D-heptose 1-phosphate adenosyltransferase
MNNHIVDISDIEAFLAKTSSINAVVVGDLMLDEYLWGATERISPEAPVPIVSVGREDLRLGGAGNVVNNLRVLGANVALASILGDDRDGEVIRERLRKAQVDVDALVHDPARITSRKTRILSGNQQMLRIDRESTLAIEAEMEQQLLQGLNNKIASADVIYLSDYGKGVLSESLIQGVIAQARQKNIPVVVDPKGTALIYTMTKVCALQGNKYLR